jgi:WD40 repeat protein
MTWANPDEDDAAAAAAHADAVPMTPDASVEAGAAADGPECFHAMDLSASATIPPVAALTLVTEFAIGAGKAGAASAGADDDEPHDNFLKAVKWSPDGVCLLTCGAEDNTFRIYDVPADLGSVPPVQDDGGGAGADALWPALRIKERESVYDYCWYPRMSASDPQSCVFATTCRGHPIHLWDAFTGTLRASYLGYDHLDEPTAAFSVCFSSDGARILAGREHSSPRPIKHGNSPEHVAPTLEFKASTGTGV